MNTFLALFQGLPVVILISVIFGLGALIRIYLLVNPGIRRLSTQDRRRTLTLPSFPFYDCNNKLISEDRRKLNNRRLASHVIDCYVIH